MISDSYSLEKRLHLGDLGLKLGEPSYKALSIIKRKFNRGEFDFVFTPDSHMLADILTKRVRNQRKIALLHRALRGTLVLRFQKEKVVRARKQKPAENVEPELQGTSSNVLDEDAPGPDMGA